MNPEDRLRAHFAKRQVDQATSMFVVSRAVARLPEHRQPRAGRVWWAVTGTAAIVLLGFAVVVSAPRSFRPDTPANPAGALSDSTATPAAAIPVVSASPVSTATAFGALPEPAATPSPACTPWPSLPPLQDLGLTDDPPTFSDEANVEKRYWDEVSRFGLAAQSYESLREIADDSQLIVVGHLVGLQLGQMQPFDVPAELDRPLLSYFGLVAVDQLIKGEPVYAAPGTILVQDLGPEIRMELPTRPVLMFLQNEKELREQYHVRPSCDPEDALHYARPNRYQSVLLIHDGVLSVIQGPKGWQAAFGSFPSELDGRALEDVVAEIKALSDS